MLGRKEKQSIGIGAKTRRSLPNNPGEVFPHYGCHHGKGCLTSPLFESSGHARGPDKMISRNRLMYMWVLSLN